MGTKTIAPIISATKFIEIIVVSTIAICACSNNHIINMVHTLFVKIPNAPEIEARAICQFLLSCLSLNIMPNNAYTPYATTPINILGKIDKTP